MLPEHVVSLRARLEAAVAMDAPPEPDRVTIEAVATLYLTHAEKRYNARHGRKELATIRNALEPLRTLYGDLHPSELTAVHLRAVRQYFISELDNCRSTMQAKMERVRRFWQWASDLDWFNWTLPTIGKVPFGHVRQPERIQPVDLAVYEATLPFVSPIAGVMLRLIRWTGMRPGEACDLHSADLDRASAPWRYRPVLHKTKHLDKTREVFIGPRAQLLLAPHVKPGRFFFTRRGKPYTSQLLYNAVHHATHAHGLPAWHPNQLRHSAATLIRQELGLESAQAVLGHARLETTQIYSARLSSLAQAAAMRLG